MFELLGFFHDSRNWVCHWIGVAVFIGVFAGVCVVEQMVAQVNQVEMFDTSNCSMLKFASKSSMSVQCGTKQFTLDTTADFLDKLLRAAETKAAWSFACTQDTDGHVHCDLVP